MTDGQRSTTSFQTSLTKSSYQDATSTSRNQLDGQSNFDSSSIATVDAPIPTPTPTQREKEEDKDGNLRQAQNVNKQTTYNQPGNTTTPIQESVDNAILNKNQSRSNTDQSQEGSGTTREREEREDSSSIPDKGSDGKEPIEKKRNRLVQRLHQELDPSDTTFQLACQAGLTGYIDIVVYAKSAVWSGYITGTMVQFAQNIAQFMLPNAERNPLLTLERAIVIIAFFLGSFFGNQLGNRLGHRNRTYLILTTFIQSCLLFGASGIALSRPEGEVPTFTWWPPIMMFCAMSFGLQSIAGQKMVSAPFATTVAFTATMTQLASDPYLFVFSLKPTARKNAAGRNRRLIAIVSLMTGAGVGEMIQYTRIGTQGALVVGAAAKIVLALLWLLPNGQLKKTETSKA